MHEEWDRYDGKKNSSKKRQKVAGRVEEIEIDRTPNRYKRERKYERLR